MEQEYKKRRSVFVGILLALIIAIGVSPGFLLDPQPFETEQTEVLADSAEGSELARDVLETLAVKGRASKAGYSRDEFGSGWASIDGCDTRNLMLQDGLTDIELADDSCVVLRGTLQDPYTGHIIEFTRGSSTSSDVQIDHVVALSDSWQKGAQQLDFSVRVVLANDPLNLLAVDGPANQEKGDSDAASWLPANKFFRCRYVARQIAVKSKYSLWVTPAEKAAMKRILNGCGDQVIPIEK
jgi:hypothetical protein